MIAWKSLALALIAPAVLAFPAACEKKPAEPQPAPTPAPVGEAPKAAPALWSIADADTTVYFFGTVHILRPTTQWRTPRLEKVLGEAKAVYFETDVNPNPASLMKFVRDKGIYPRNESLADHLTTDQNSRLAAAAAKLSIPIGDIEVMRPWLAATKLSDELIVKSGYNPESGVERTLQPMIKSSTEVRKLETVEEQLGVFAGLSEKVQIAYLMDGVDQLDTDQHLLDQLVDAWARGDTASIAKLMIEDDLADVPEVYQALLVKRNSNWAVTLDALLKNEPGSFLVAVGAGHLVGEDSVLAKLTARGYTVTRVQ
jgi:uncharacterized protein YbaP (TraB family)